MIGVPCMKISKIILKVANGLVTYIVILTLCISGVYAGYALWDNNLVFAQVDDVQADMLKLKPDARRPSFDELLAINQDVVGWITLDNTNIDYPVMQGETNLTYFNMDIYGDFALGGSIYLDSRNDPNFNDPYSLLYGHYMASGRMFGDLERYKEEDFFNKNQKGSLLMPDKVYELEVYATLLVKSSDEAIFNPPLWNDNINGLIEYAENNALYLNDMDIDESVQILAFTTCTTEFTDARTVVLTVMKANTPG